MISLKPGALIEWIKPEILVGLLILESIFRKYEQDLIITEGTGGVHKADSLHYKGLAFDIRSKNLSGFLKDKIFEEGKKALGDNFRLLWEDVDKENEHFHIQYSPPIGK